MPKIIENLESKLIAEAKKQIEESGYSAMTIRSVAAGCGVGVAFFFFFLDFAAAPPTAHSTMATASKKARILTCFFTAVRPFRWFFVTYGISLRPGFFPSGTAAPAASPAPAGAEMSSGSCSSPRPPGPGYSSPGRGFPRSRTPAGLPRRF